MLWSSYPHVPGEEEVGEGEVPVHDAVAVQVQQAGDHLDQGAGGGVAGVQGGTAWPICVWEVTGGHSGRQPGAIYQLQGRRRESPFRGAPTYQGSLEEYHIPLA